MIAPNVAHIPNYLAASTPNGLRRLMLLNNTKKGQVFAYQILYDGKRWIAWYHDTLEAFTQQIVKESEDGSAE